MCLLELRSLPTVITEGCAGGPLCFDLMLVHPTTALVSRVVTTPLRFSRGARRTAPCAASSAARQVPMPTVSQMATSNELVSIGELLSTCVDAALRGCDEIRAVQSRRSTTCGALASTRKDKDDPRSALTEADTNAQAAIVDALRATWPGLRIVGEEEEHDADGAGSANARSLRRDLCQGDTHDASEWREPLDALFVFVDPVDGTREFVEGRLNAVQCLIGVACRGRAVAGAIGLPFPEGGLTKETTVVWGVARPGNKTGEHGVFGATRAPPPRFGDDAKQRLTQTQASDSSVTAPGGDAKQRLTQTQGCNSSVTAPDAGLICVTGDSGNESLAAARVVADCALNCIAGGAGNKILAVAEGRADVALMHFGTSLWDTCAPEAVLRSRGGKVTDLFGAPLAHHTERPDAGLVNDLGVLATACDVRRVDIHGRDHAAIAAAMRADETLVKLLSKYSGQSSEKDSRNSGCLSSENTDDTNTFVPQASDVARCLAGSPLRVGTISRAVTSTLCGGDEPGTLLSYSAPESSAIRGLMSDAVRLELSWGQGSAGMPSTVFYKRVKLGDLEYARTKAKTQPMKIARDVKSAGVEAAFLASSEVTSALANAGVRVPRCFHADLRPCPSDPIESSFALVLEDFAPAQGWHQEKLLNPAQARAVLSTLARMHATFTHAASAARGDNGKLQHKLASAVWPAGAYWQPKMQPADQMITVAAIWRDTHLPKFAKAFQETLTGDTQWETLGERLQAVAVEVGDASHPFGLDAPNGNETVGEFAKWRTLIHGDAKAANVFLRQATEAAGKEQEEYGWEIGLIDFQWMGFGLGVVDAAHVIAASVDPVGLGFAPGETSGASLRDGTFDDTAAADLLTHYHDEFINASVANGAAVSIEAARTAWPIEEAAAQYDAAILDFARCVFGYQWVRVGASPASLKEAADSFNKNSYNKSLPNAMWLVRECDAALRRRQP